MNDRYKEKRIPEDNNRKPVDPIRIIVRGAGHYKEYILPCFSDLERQLNIGEIEAMIEFFQKQRQPGGSFPMGQDIAKAISTTHAQLARHKRMMGREDK